MALSLACGQSWDAASQRGGGNLNKFWAFPRRPRFHALSEYKGGRGVSKTNGKFVFSSLAKIGCIY
jgi:hypothetical protein